MAGNCRHGGDLVFYGTMDGWFKAVRPAWRLLWKHKLDSGVIGQPVSYKRSRRASVCRSTFRRRRLVRGRSVRAVDPRDGSAALGL